MRARFLGAHSEAIMPQPLVGEGEAFLSHPPTSGCRLHRLTNISEVAGVVISKARSLFFFLSLNYKIL